MYVALGTALVAGVAVAFRFLAQTDAPSSPWEWVDTGGLVGLLLLNVWALLTGRVVPKGTVEQRDRELADLKADRDKYLNLALSATTSAEKATDVIEQKLNGDAEERLARAVVAALDRRER